MHQQTTGPLGSNASAPAPWREPWLAVLVTALPLAVAAVAAVVVPDFALSVDDSVSHAQPNTSAVFRQLAAGELPLWSHHLFCGMPLYAVGNVLHPGAVVAHIIGRTIGLVDREVTTSSLVYLMVGSLSVWLFLRYHGCRVAAAAAGAIAFVCAGPFWGLWTNWNPYGWSAAMVPPTLLVIDVALAHRGRLRDGWREVLLVAAVTSVMLLVGDLQHVVKHAMLGSAYAVLRADRAAWRSGGPVLVAGAALACCCGLAQCLAVWDYVGNTNRVSAAGVSVEDFFLMSVPPGGLMGLVDPFVLQTWRGFGTATFHGAAISIGPLFPVIAGVLCTRAWWGRSVPRALTIIFSGALVLALGDSFPPNQLLHSLPVIKNFRWPVRWMVEACTVGPLVIGLAMDTVVRALDASTRSADAAAAGRRLVRGCGLAFGVAWMLRIVLPDGAERSSDVAVASSLGWFISGTALIAMAAAGLRAGRDNARLHRLFALLAVTIALLHGLLVVPVAQRQRFADPDLRNLRENPIVVAVGEYERVWQCLGVTEQRRLHRGGNLFYALPNQFGTRSVAGYNYGLKWQVWRSFIGLQGQINAFPDFHAAVLDPEHKGLLQLLRVGAIVIASEDEASRAKLERHPDFSLEQSTEQLVVFRHNGFREPAWFVDDIVIIPPGPAPLHRIDTTKTAVLWDQALTQPVVKKLRPGCRVTAFREHHALIDAAVECPEDGMLVVNTTFYPGWTATADGRPTELVMADTGFMGVVVPRGTTSVQLRYRPRWLVAAFAFSTAAWVAVSATFIVCIVPWLLRGWRENVAAADARYN